MKRWLRARWRLFSGSIVRRYSLLLIVASVAPIAVVGFVYDQYVRGMLDQITGERLEAQLAATASRLTAFLDARTYQLERLARYPTPPRSNGGLGDELVSLARLEADDADLYGILVFANDGSLREIVRGQAAAGPPYWPEAPFELARLGRGRYREAELVGPSPPGNGYSGWFLLQEPLRGGGHIALHVRLASLTDLLGAPSIAGVLEPVLRTPAGYFDAVGQPATVHGKLIEGPEIAPGWRPCLLVDPQELLRPFEVARHGLLVGSLFAVGAIGVVLTRMAGRLKRRVEVLANGAEQVAGGDFDHRVPDLGEDEIGTVAVAFNRMASKLRRHVEREVRLERLAALGEFSTGVAHEIRNPLATLKTTVQALARSESDPERSTLLRDMEQEIDRMSRTVGQILAFGRPRPPEPVRLRIRDVARRLESIVRNEAARREVEFSLQGDLELHARADEDHVLQILLNLVINALEATPAGGLVTLRSYRDGDRVAIEIRDTGSGIPPDRLARVFVPFFTSKPGGTGLGLSISRLLAQLNGGSLELESTPGQGTTVRLLLEHGGDSQCPAS